MLLMVEETGVWRRLGIEGVMIIVLTVGNLLVGNIHISFKGKSKDSCPLLNIVLQF